VRFASALRAAAATLPSDLAECERILSALPARELEFKRAFDEYSEGVSYKQQYQDKNAFLVYYTRGYDGPGRPSIEDMDAEREERQRTQFGARNDAWIAVDDARSELAYLRGKSGAASDEEGEVAKALARAAKALDAYLALAPAEQLEQARQLVQPAAAETRAPPSPIASARTVRPRGALQLRVAPVMAAEPQGPASPPADGSPAAVPARPAVIAAGVVGVREGEAAPPSDAAALYVTARVAAPEWQSAGKTPPLASARFAAPSLPFEFELSAADLTAEYLNVPQREWDALDLAISCRLDTDGVAATRDASDLVGRAQLIKRGQREPAAWSPVRVELQGRGLAGKLVVRQK